jgi:hypothetical protein
VSAVNVGNTHASHDEAPAAEKVLIAHASHALDPLASECRPAAQAEHCSELSLAEKNPSAHSAQVARSVDNFEPAGHGPHTATVAFASSGWRNVPRLHTAHLVDDDNGSTNVPVGHATQLVAPVCGAMLVTAHAAQSDAPAEP